MTTTRRDPEPAWRRHPFAISICDPAGTIGDALTVSLARALSDRFRVATLKDTVPEHRVAASEDVTRLLRMDTQDVLSVPRTGEDIHWPALLVADVLLVQQHTASPGPAIVCAGDGRPQDSGNVVAWAAAPEACPVLPPDAPFFTTAQVGALAAHLIEWLEAFAATTPVYGLALAGGKSTRMGQDKGGLAWSDGTQVERCVESLHAVCDKVFVSIRPDQASASPYNGLACIRDRFDGFGPVGGVLSAMTTHPTAAWLVLACDMPLVDGETLSVLTDARDPFRAATCFRADDGKPEPLCAVYEPKSTRLMFDRLAAGDASLRRMLATQRVTMADAPAPERLKRANTPEEFAAIRAMQA